MGEIDEALVRADEEGFTRPPPSTLRGRVNFLLRQLGSARAVAAELGVTADSVNRYRRGARRNPPPEVARRLEAAVRQRWQPRVRRRRRQAAATRTGITIETRARFGYAAAPGTTDDPRFRRLTVHLPPAYARRLFDARDTGAPEGRMRQIVAEGLREVYFQDDGRRAAGLEVEFTGIDYLDASF